MKTEVKQFLTTTLIVGTVAATGVGLAAKYFINKKEAQKTKQELRQKEQQNTLNDLVSEKSTLDSIYLVYNNRHAGYIAKSKNFKAENPAFDNMDALNSLVQKVYKNVENNYTKQNEAFVKKAESICKKFCNKNGMYCFYDENSTEYRKPTSVYEFLEIIQENYDKIPNYEAIIQEYERLEAIDDLIYSFSGFICGIFDEYINRSAGEKSRDAHSAQKVIDYDTIHFEDGYYLAQEIYRFMEDDEFVYKCNSVDNIKQDDLITVLYRDYLQKFKKYNTGKTVLLDEKLYAEIVDCMLTIKQHNEIESGIISYNLEIKDISKRKSDIDEKIASIRQEQVKMK